MSKYQLIFQFNFMTTNESIFKVSSMYRPSHHKLPTMHLNNSKIFKLWKLINCVHHQHRISNNQLCTKTSITRFLEYYLKVMCDSHCYRSFIEEILYLTMTAAWNSSNNFREKNLPSFHNSSGFFFGVVWSQLWNTSFYLQYPCFKNTGRFWNGKNQSKTKQAQ